MSRAAEGTANLEYLKQNDYRVRFDWGIDGLQALAREDGVVGIRTRI